MVLQHGDWAGGLTTLYFEKSACYEIIHRALDLDGFFGMI
jgi:hypothetical protein